MWEKFEATLKARELTQKDLEELLCLPKNRITKWKAQGDKISVAEARRIAKRLNISLDYLIDDEVDEPTPSPAPVLTKDEEFMLDLIRSLGMSRKEVALRLSGRVGKSPNKTTVRHKKPKGDSRSAG